MNSDPGSLPDWFRWGVGGIAAGIAALAGHFHIRIDRLFSKVAAQA